MSYVTTDVTDLLPSGTAAQWVRLLSGSQYYISRNQTDDIGTFTIHKVPNGTYTLGRSISPNGPWITEDSAYVVALNPPVNVPTVYNVATTYGADPTGVVDAVAAIQNAINAAQTAGGGIVYIPPGTYKLTATTTAGGITWHLAIANDKVTIWWAPGALLSTTVDSSVFLIHGALKVGAWYLNRYVDATVYAISSVAKGAKQVTCTTPAQAGNFAVGDWIFIKTGECIALFQTPPAEPDSELNQVTSVNAGTGVLGLRWPTAKPYVLEYWQAGPTGPSTTVDAGAGSPPFGVSKVTDRTLQQLRFINPRISSTFASATNPVLAGGQFYDFRVEGGSGDVAAWFSSFSNQRSVVWDKTIVRCSVDGLYHFTAATGSTGVLFDDIELAVPSGVGQIHIHEGSAQVRVRGGRILNGGSATSLNCISIRGRAYDIAIDDPFIYNGGTSNGPMIYVDSSCGGSGMGGRIRAIFGGIGSGSITVVPTSGWSIDRSLEIGTQVGGQSVPLGNDWLEGELYISADAMQIQGAAPVRVITSGGVLTAWDLRHGFVDGVAGKVRIPRSWQKYQVIVQWINDGAGAGNVVWSVYSVDCLNGGNAGTLSLNTAITAAAAAQNLLTASTTPVSTPVVTGADFTEIIVQRNGTSGSDTLVNVAGLVGVILRRTQ